MNILSKKYIKHISIIIASVLGIIVGYFVFSALFKLTMPFILAYIIAHISDPIVTFMEKKLKLPRKIASAITILSTLALLGSILIFIISRIIFEIKNLTEKLPYFIHVISERLKTVFEKGTNFYVTLPPEISLFVDNVIENISNNLSSLLKPATEATTRFAYNFATSLPSIIVFIIVFFVSAYFMSCDKDLIGKFIEKQLPASWKTWAVRIKNDLLYALLGYLKAQLILMSITFVEVSIGLLIIGVDYAILIALFISVIDFFPILGTGTILIPWALISFITGNYPMGFSLIILYGVVTLVRQLLEPKIVGVQIGLYPLVTLMSMYIGLQLMGLPGMIMGPIVVLIVRNLQKAGLFKLWND
ncbi:MAG: sporulation integral membrane protein YtvI [Clostridiaceae bacterium]|nr:sporulation integral membrane protein YtvI [Clostridiaceae bacterium]